MNKYLKRDKENFSPDKPEETDWIIVIWSAVSACLITIGIICLARSEMHIKLSNRDSEYERIDDGRYVFLTGEDSNIVASLISPELSVGENNKGYGDEALFYLTRQRNGYYSIVSVYSWRYWTVDENATVTTEKEFTGDPEQLWMVRYLEEDRYAICTYDGGMVRIEDGKMLIDKERCTEFRFLSRYEH